MVRRVPGPIYYNPHDAKLDPSLSGSYTSARCLFLKFGVTIATKAVNPEDTINSSIDNNSI